MSMHATLVDDQPRAPATRPAHRVLARLIADQQLDPAPVATLNVGAQLALQRHALDRVAAVVETPALELVVGRAPGTGIGRTLQRLPDALVVLGRRESAAPAHRVTTHQTIRLTP